MKPEITSPSNEPELDFRALCRALWHGKYWIAGFTFLFAGMALSIAYLVKQDWVATMVVDKPGVNTLSNYYAQQQFLRNVSKNLGIALVDESLPVVDKAYHEFIMQLGAFDTRRDFWLINDYYKQRQKNDASDAKLLSTLINSIEFMPHDDKKILYDSLKLTAETAVDAHRLLQQYVEFARQRSVDNLNAETQMLWHECTQWINEQIKWQEAAIWDRHRREIDGIQQAMKAAGCPSAKISAEADMPAEQSSCFTDTAGLQSRLGLLQATGPDFDSDYSYHQAMLATLVAGPALDASFQTYRYLRAPDRPVESDSPRRSVLFLIWGGIGALTGAGVALMRHQR